MDAERLKKIEEIYHAVLEIPMSERENFFKKRCGEDAELRREVESLLAFEKTAGNFLDASPEALAAEMFSAEENDSNLLNTQIGRYRIKKLLGKGGMGEVYLAEDTTLNRKVALKFLSAAISANKSRLRRFEQEAFAASALNHPNILTIYEFGSDGGTYFLAAEFVEGETLRELMNRKELSLKEILNIAEQTAFALAAAHRSGIIHRDIKPDNIMRREDGIVKVLDFGLAKLSEIVAVNAGDKEASTRKFALTNPGMVMGTAAYMSPEQTRGLSDVDARTDIWSLGVVIFEMITGRTPFAGESVSDIIASVLKNDAPHLSKFVPDCPPELDRIVTKALKKDREERYQVIKDLALDLKSLRREQEFSAEFERPTDGAERNITAPLPKQAFTTAENGKRFSALQMVSIVLAVALVFGGAWWYFSGKNKTETAVDALAPPRTVEVTNWNSSPGEFYSVGSFSPDGKMVAFASTKTGAKNIWIKQATAGDALQITKDEFDNKQPIWSPTGDELAFFSTRGNKTGVWRIPLFGGSPKFIAAIDDGSSTLRFWSKKNLIYYQSLPDIYAIDANSGQTKQITDFASNAVNAESLSISPDEQRVAYVVIEGERWNLWTKNLNADAPEKVFTADAEIRNTVFHPDNQRIFFSVSALFRFSSPASRTRRNKLLSQKETVSSWTFHRTARKFYTVRRKKIPTFGA
jgi:serine/threonine protein kinase